MYKYSNDTRRRKILAGTSIRGYVRYTLQELKSQGYDTDNMDYIAQDQEICREHGLLLVGYALNDAHELAIVAEDARGNQDVYESSGGRLYHLDF